MGDGWTDGPTDRWTLDWRFRWPSFHNGIYHSTCSQELDFRIYPNNRGPEFVGETTPAKVGLSEACTKGCEKILWTPLFLLNVTSSRYRSYLFQVLPANSRCSYSGRWSPSGYPDEFLQPFEPQKIIFLRFLNIMGVVVDSEQFW